MRRIIQCKQSTFYLAFHYLILYSYLLATYNFTSNIKNRHSMQFYHEQELCIGRIYCSYNCNNRTTRSGDIKLRNSYHFSSNPNQYRL